MVVLGHYYFGGGGGGGGAKVASRWGVSKSALKYTPTRWSGGFLVQSESVELDSIQLVR